MLETLLLEGKCAEKLGVCCGARCHGEMCTEQVLTLSLAALAPCTGCLCPAPWDASSTTAWPSLGIPTVTQHTWDHLAEAGAEDRDPPMVL